MGFVFSGKDAALAGPQHRGKRGEWIPLTLGYLKAEKGPGDYGKNGERVD